MKCADAGKRSEPLAGETRTDMADIDNDEHLRIDGRTARRDRNRTAVLDAVIDLFAEGNLTPGVHDVADRSGVSLRSVYRYFDDVDDLIAAAIDRRIEAAAPLFATPDDAGASTEDRIRLFCERRVALFLEIRSVYRASVIRSADQSRLRIRVRRSREALDQQTATTFAGELDALPEAERVVVCEMLDALSQFDTIERLLDERGHDPAGAVEFLVRAFLRVLAPVQARDSSGV